MAKRGYGLAGAIEPGKKIFYGSLFSQFQIGRMTDLLCLSAAEAGVHLPSFRAVLQASLEEACRGQGLFSGSQTAMDPVTIEFGADSTQGALSVQFNIQEDRNLSADLAQALFSLGLPARELVFSVDPETRRAEIFCIVPLEGEAGRERPPVVANHPMARFELLSEGSDQEADSGAESSIEYVALGDVDYESKSGSVDKIVEVATDPATLLARGLSEDELARIVKGSMSEDDLARTVTGGLPESELARIVKGSSTPQELQELVRFSSDKARIAESVLVGSSREEAAELIKTSVGKQELGQAIATALPAGKLASLAAGALPAEEFVKIARENMAPEQFVQTVKGALSPQQAAGFAAHAIKSPEICKAVLRSLSPAEMAQSLKAGAPERLAEAARAEASRMSPERIIETLSNGLPRGEYAKMVASAIPREQFSKILIEGLPPQELARSLQEGLPKEKFAQLVAASLPKEKIAQALEPRPPSGSMVPPQERLASAQVAELLGPGLTQGQAVSILASVLPQAAAESIFSGVIPRAEVTEALKSHLPSPELASDVTDKLLEAQPEPALQSRLGAAQKAVEFYLVRSKTLETQLRMAEEANRIAQRETQAAKIKLERVLQSSSAAGETEGKDQAAPPAAGSDARSRKDKEALAFFQKKAREFEQELRKAEAELRRVNAEHTNELLKLAQEREALASQGAPRAVEVDAPEASEPSTDRALNEKIRQLEAKVCIAAEEKARLLQRLEEKGAEISVVGSRDAPETESPEAEEARKLSQAKPSPREDDSVDVGEKLEASYVEVERDMNGIAQRVEQLKVNVTEAPARRAVEGLMTAIMQEKAKLIETSRALSKSVRKKELGFKNQEAMLTESLKQAIAVSEQRHAAIDRLKKQLSEAQQKLDHAAKNPVGSNEAQIRVKYEQSQRQIETLYRELEKSSRRQTPQAQGNSLAQERMIAEMRKQVENAAKVTTAKKQELEAIKVQLLERDRREEQYKRQIMKLQGDLIAARGRKAS